MCPRASNTAAALIFWLGMYGFIGSSDRSHRNKSCVLTRVSGFVETMFRAVIRFRGKVVGSCRGFPRLPLYAQLRPPSATPRLGPGFSEGHATIIWATGPKEAHPSILWAQTSAKFLDPWCQAHGCLGIQGLHSLSQPTTHTKHG